MVSHRLFAVFFTSFGLLSRALDCSAEEDENPPAGTLTDGGPGSAQGDAATSDGPLGQSTLPPACASATASADVVPVNLVFLFDTSASMVTEGSGSSNVKAQKWDPVLQTFKSFFTDATVSGMSASLTTFPWVPAEESCAESRYSTPRVPMTALPSTGFPNALDALAPSGGTPTQPALAGALSYAKQIATARPNQRTAVVLVTDGEPGGPCSNNTVQTVSATAAAGYKGSPSIPTYVVGVGSTLTNLNEFAQAGGTKQATLVSVGDPSKTAQELRAALTTAGGRTLSCDLALPRPPDGATIDPRTVRVVYTPGTGTPETIPLQAECTGEGWRYDNPTAPTRIQLCPTTCNRVRSVPAAKVEVAADCTR